MRRALLFACSVAIAGCGGSGSTPTTPSNPTPPAQQNRAPSITSVTVNPTFGVADLQRFNFTAIASDPDGDALSYTWDLAGNAATSSTPQFTFVSPGGDGTASVTVTDGRGGSANGRVDFTVGSMSGTWVGNGPGALTRFGLQLTQSINGFVRGSMTVPGFNPGQVDPSQPGQIQPDGRVTMRMKVPPFTDFTFTGVMDSTGRRVTGSVSGSGFTGQPIVLVK